MGIVLIVVGFIFATIETWYFGWNLWAETPAEQLCDGFSIMVTGVGLGVHWKEQQQETTND